MISVIIPALNEEEGIVKCLRSLRKQAYKGKFEIILVDGFSRDKTVEAARPFVDRIVKKRAKGPAAARNEGADHAKYPILAFVDADCEVDKNWLDQIEHAFKNPALIGLGGVLRPQEGSLFDKIVFKINSDWWVRLSALLGIYQLYGNNCAYRKDAFHRLHGFSTAISFFEDTEMSMRAKRAGKIAIDPDMAVYASTRRFKQKGYLAVAAINIKAFLSFTFHKPITTKYFDEIRH